MSLSKTQIFLFFESGNYVKATRRLPQASSLSCLHRFIIIFVNGAIYIIVLKLRIVPIVLVIAHITSIRIRLCRFLCLLLFLDSLKYEESTTTGSTIRVRIAGSIFVDFGFSSGAGSVISGTVSTTSGFVSSTGLVNSATSSSSISLSNQSPLFLSCAIQKNIQQIFDMAFSLQGFHEQRMPFVRLASETMETLVHLHARISPYPSLLFFSSQIVIWFLATKKRHAHHRYGNELTLYFESIFFCKRKQTRDYCCVSSLICL